MIDPANISHYYKTRAWMFFVLYCGLIFFLSHQPGDPNMVFPFAHFDKFVHFMEYLVLGFFLQRALVYSQIPRVIWITLGFALLFGISDEIHQSFVPYRNSDWRDLIADLLGATTSIFIYQAILPPKYRDSWTGKPAAQP